MEQQIQDLVDSIRKEGIEEARREKEAILADARAEADRILSSAREKAYAMVEEATKECALRQQSAKASLAQAARDVSLALKNTINKELGAILGDSIASALDKDLISRIVSSAVDAGLKDADIVVSAPDAEALVKALRSSLADKLKNGLALKVGSGRTGLVIQSRDGSGYIDLSADEMAELIRPCLSDAVKAQVFD